MTNKMTFRALALAGAFTVTIAATASAQEKMRIGGLIPLTGGAALVGLSYEAGNKLAQAEINAAGGIAGKQIEMVWADTASDGTQASNEAKRLVFQEKVVAIMGPPTSQETIPANLVTTEAKILFITTAASPLLNTTVAPYHFSDSASAAGQAIPMVRYAVKDKGYKKIGILSDNGGLSKAAVEAMNDELKTSGMTATAIQEFPFNVDDMTPQILGLRRAGVDVVLFVSSTREDSKKLIVTMNDVGWKVPVVSNTTITNYGQAIAREVPAGSFDNISATAWGGYSACKTDALGTSNFAKFIKRAEAAVPDLAKKGGPSGIGQSYSMLHIFKQAVEANGGKTDGPTLAKWLENNAGKLDTILGTLAASDKDHFMIGLPTIAIVSSPDKVRADGLFNRANC